MQLLLKSRSKIEKELNVAEAEDLFKYIPTELIVDYLDLYRIKLTDKEYGYDDIERKTSFKSYLEISGRALKILIDCPPYSMKRKNIAK